MTMLFDNRYAVVASHGWQRKIDTKIVRCFVGAFSCGTRKPSNTVGYLA